VIDRITLVRGDAGLKQAICGGTYPVIDRIPLERGNAGLKQAIDGGEASVPRPLALGQVDPFGLVSLVQPS
jgi:hypothetical protein